MSTIIPFEQYHFPIGRLVFHSKYGLCEIVAVQGLERVIGVKMDTENEEYVWVPVSQLEPFSLSIDTIDQ